MIRRPLVAIGMVAAVVALAGTGWALTSGGSSPTNPPTAAASPTPTSTGTAGSTPTEAPTPTAIPTPTPAPTPLLVAAPLTGRLVPPSVAARHPIAVMIDDLDAARPQSGLSSASVVWQAPAEGGIPRYMAIFQETVPGSVGPVRSSRYYYIAWAAEWHALYAHAGGSPQALATLRAQGQGQLVYNADEFFRAGSFFRIKTRFAPHNLYTTGAKLRSLAGRSGAKDQTYKSAWKFAPDAPLDQRPYGGTITAGYPANVVKYTYDRLTNTYLRTVTGEKKQTDLANGVRIAPKNVIVMRMAFGPLNDGHPNKKRLEATVVGSGSAWISTNGRTMQGTWKKTSLTSPTRFYDASGNEVTLTVGQTFIQVLTQSASVYPFSFTAGSDRPPVSPSPSTK
ncbi:MAG TPA: DUF3048 domain-containing protein [Candidatus Limnocylindrales bacterium]|nr:DUF3048 domain-containing protein [Candidatus Limnocylindrales bacterium]